MSTLFSDAARRRLAGSLILFAMLAMTAGLLALPVSSAVAGAGYWSAALLLWPDLSRRNRLQAQVLLLVGGICLAISAWLGADISTARLLSGNTGLLSMLVAVSFLSLVSRPNGEQEDRLPRGKGAVVSTLGAVHLFGSVINLSSVFIIGDRLARRSSVSREQAIVLIRGFTAAAFWSPFFGAMAVALSVAPDARLSTLWLVSMPLALLAMSLTFYQLWRPSSRKEGRAPISDFVGYPLHLGGIRLPALLAIAVLVLHQLWPALSILAVITLLAPVFSVSVLAADKRSPLAGVRQLTTGRLPQMGNELALFLAAGVLAYGLESLLSSWGGHLALEHLGATEASLTYLAIVLLSLCGIHPIVGIALAGSVLMPLEPDHTLLALVFLSSWAVGTASGPLSGINLAFQGRYGIDSFAIMRWNSSYLILMSACVVAAIWLLARMLGV